MTGEYDGLTVEQLWDLISQDDPDKLDDYAQGWTDAALVFDTELETLEGHYETVKAMWTSKAAGPYLGEIAKTIANIKQASDEAKLRADSLSTVASNVRQANQRVKEEYDAWMVKKNAAHQDNVDKAERILSGEFSFQDFTATNFNTEEERRPHDEVARTYLNNSAESITRQMKPVILPVKDYQPIKFDAGRTWDATDLKNIDFSGDGGQSFAVDTGALAAGHSGPALQSGATPAPTAPPAAPAGPAPTGPGNLGAPAPAGLPAGGVSPVGRTPTPPATRVPNPGVRPMRGTPPATRTPGLPGNRAANPARTAGGPRSGGSAPRGGERAGRSTTGRGGRSAGRGAGRGLTKSRMAPQDRTGRVRSSGEVLGRRGAGTSAETEKTTGSRSIRKSIVGRSGAGRGGRRESTRGRLDRTKQGFTKQVIGGRSRFGSGFSRSPIVARKVHDAGTVFGKRPGPVSPEQERRNRLAERHARKLAMERAAEGLARPVIGAGLVLSARIDEEGPVRNTAEQDERDFWVPGQSTVSGVIGARRPEPVVHHDPGPGVIGSPSERVEPEHRPGPTAFQVDREPPRPDWLR